MKSFLKSVSFFCVILIILYSIKPFFLLTNERYKNLVSGSQNYHSIAKSKVKNKKSKVLIIGDSVGRQLFDNYTYNDSINSLTCNVGISLVGQFILIDNYLKAGNLPDKIILIYTPFSFKNNLNNEYTFHYFLKPFYKKDYFNHFSKTVYKQIEKIPFYSMSQSPYILTSNWSPIITKIDKVNFSFLSPVSIEYIKKLSILAKKYKFKLILLPTPTRQSRQNKFEKTALDEINKNNLNNEFQYYFSNLYFLEDSCFIDDVHLKKSKVYENTLIYKNIFKQNELNLKLKLL